MDFVYLEKKKCSTRKKRALARSGKNQWQFSNNPKIWGPKLWYIMHNTALHYPKRPEEFDKTRMRLFIFTVLPSLIPCQQCRDHTMDYFKRYNNEARERIVSSEKELVHFFDDFHCYVDNIKM